MGQSQSPDLPPPGGISLARAQCHSSNAALTAARYHGRSSGRAFKDDYEMECGKVLGRGRHSAVVRARGRINKRLCAVKTFQAWALSEEAKSLMTAEVEVHLTLDHPHIVQLYDVYESKQDTVYMVMEYCRGGELFADLSKEGRYSEERAAEVPGPMGPRGAELRLQLACGTPWRRRRVASSCASATTWQMLSAVSYLHSHNVAHRDIKLENFLYADESKRSLQLIDFGFAKVCDGRLKMQAKCGTPDYVGPEVLSGDGYTSKCDMWSLGVLVFMLLTGRAPIHAEGREALQAKIRRGEVDWNKLSERCTASSEAKAFLRSLLVTDPDKRLDAQTAILHPWLLKLKADREESLRIPPSIFQSLRHYAEGSPLRRAVLQLVAQQLSQEEVQELRMLFMSLSRSGRGTISLELLREKTDPQTRLFAVCDVNQDGEVYYSDFLAATLSSLANLREEVLRAAFARLDVARTGSPGWAEFQEVFGAVFEGDDAEALVGYIASFGRNPEEGMDFEAFKAVVEGAEVPSDGSEGSAPDASEEGGAEASSLSTRGSSRRRRSPWLDKMLLKRQGPFSGSKPSEAADSQTAELHALYQLDQPCADPWPGSRAMPPVAHWESVR